MILQIDNTPQAHTRVQDTLRYVVNWMTDNSLKVNPDKTEVLAITTGSNLWTDHIWPQELGDTPSPAPVVKSLGIKIDDKLTLTNQVATVIGTCVGLQRKLRKLSPLLSFSIMRTVVTTLIMLRLDYGNALYIGLPEKLLGKLQVAMNDAARLIFKLPRHARATPLLQKLHWLPVKQRARFKGLCITHKALYGQAPRYIKERLDKYVPSRTLQSSEGGQLACPRFNRTTKGGRAFSVLIPQLWNKLLGHLRLEKALLPFMKKLKTLLFTEAWA